MADKSGIEWTDATWNPTTGCDRVSPGCANCYALTMAPRLQAMAVGRGVTDLSEPYMQDGDPKTSGPGFGLMLHPDRLDIPLRWKRPRRIFVNSMSDLFHPDVTDDFIDRVFAVMALAPQHVFQVLTKRPERMREYVSAVGPGPIAANMDAMGNPVDWQSMTWPLPNVWLGTSVENARWRTRIDELRETPAAVRFLSCEPLLGPLVCPECKGAGWYSGWDPADKTGGTEHQVQCRGGVRPECIGDLNLSGIDWVIVGGESGPGARPMAEEWVRDIVNACYRQEDAAPFVKQMGSVWSQANLGHPGHGGEMDWFPADLRIREYPPQWSPA